jgi:hypothetical protein
MAAPFENGDELLVSVEAGRVLHQVKKGTSSTMELQL